MTIPKEDTNQIGTWALFSDDRVYRYRLGERWSHRHGDFLDLIVWVMINPSIADGERADPTFKKCRYYSERWGYAAMEIVNLFAMVSTDPKKLGIVTFDPIGNCGTSKNDAMILNAVSSADKVIAAWGAGVPTGMAGRADLVSSNVRRIKPIHCLGTTKDGHPRHPLYLRNDERSRLWRA